MGVGCPVVVPSEWVLLLSMIWLIHSVASWLSGSHSVIPWLAGWVVLSAHDCRDWWFFCPMIVVRNHSAAPWLSQWSLCCHMNVMMIILLPHDCHGDHVAPWLHGDHSVAPWLPWWIVHDCHNYCSVSPWLPWQFVTLFPMIVTWVILLPHNCQDTLFLSQDCYGNNFGAPWLTCFPPLWLS